MRTREILILTGLAVAFGVLGLALLSDGAQQLAPGPATPDEVERPLPVETDLPRPELRSGDAPAPIVEAPLREERPTDPAGPGPGYGILDGSVILSSSIGHGVSQYTILVEEMINPKAATRPDAPQPVRLSRGFRAEDNESPLFFTFDRVPFSRYGYRVSVFVAGLNGSSQVVQVTESSWAPEVTLSLSGGAPFSLRLIDQLHDPYAARSVLIRPEGTPQGRPSQHTETDNFGTAVYESALAGGYEVLMDGQPVGRVMVDPPGFVNDEAGLGVQSAMLIIPRGVTLRVEITDQGGFGLAEVDVTLFAVDTTENRRFEARSEASGIVDFEHVPSGRYQLNLSGPGRQPTSRSVKIEDGVAPEPVRVRMALQ